MKGFQGDQTTETAGYASPPKNTRWKKGQSGNPSGRPKATVSPQKMSQVILQTPLKSKNGRKLNRTRQDHMMLQIALDAITSIKAARLIFDTAHPRRKTRAAPIPNEVLADLRKLRAMKAEFDILPTNNASELMHKFRSKLRIGELTDKIERAIAEIPLPMEEDDE
jgi:hypothetical protein